MGIKIRLDAGEPELLMEVLAYMGRRFSDSRDSTTLLELEDQLEAARRALIGRRRVEIDLASRRVDLLIQVLASYIEEFRRPAAAADNRQRISRLRRIGRRLQSSSTFFGRLRQWLGLP